MTLEEAKKLVVEKKLISKVSSVLEYKDFWVFEYPEDVEIDVCPPAVRKSDGKVFAFFFPEYANQKFSVLKL